MVNRLTKKVMVVFGTRPEAIKMVPVINKLKEKDSEVVVCATAQHREMLDQVLNFFEINPDFDLNVMTKNQDLSTLTSKIILELKEIIEKVNPDWIVVQGDTTTTFCAALSAFYFKIPVAHIEAGLRTGNKHAPWPEEVNRKLTTHIADIHFAPTQESKDNLIREGINEKEIYITGNTAIDALIRAKKIIEEAGSKFAKDLEFINSEQKLILVTGHRRENFGEKLQNICEALKEISEKHPEVQIVYPVHLNPNVQKTVEKILSEQRNIYLLPPLPYPQFVYLMNKSYLIITDSGGIQEEAPSLNKPVLVTRESTERQEAVNTGATFLVGSDKTMILEKIDKLISNKEEYSRMSGAQNPYGNGTAAEKIADILLRKFSNDSSNFAT